MFKPGCLFIVLLLTANSMPAFSEERPKLLAFTNVTIIDGTGAPAKPDMTLVVTGNRIKAIGRSDRVAIPEGAQPIDCSGRGVYSVFRDFDFRDGK